MDSFETHSPTDESFEIQYGRFVADLVVQSKMTCHDRPWVESAAAQLTDLVTDHSGLERDEVRTRLNGIWLKVIELGHSVYLQKLSDTSVE